jgi:hypothetical protein
MQPAFGHPLWISSGVLMLVIGALLFRWARRSTAAHRVAVATREAAVDKLFKGGQKSSQQSAQKTLAPHRFRQAMAQLFGVIGFLLIIAGLMAIFLGIFYVGS